MGALHKVSLNRFGEAWKKNRYALITDWNEENSNRGKRIIPMFQASAIESKTREIGK